MIKPEEDCIDYAQDSLYRRLDREFVDQETGEIKPGAYLDAGKNYKGLSLFVKRAFETPAQFLEQFAKFPETRKRCGTVGPPTAEQMYEAGYRVAECPASFIQQHNLGIKSPQGRRQIGASGHIDVINGQDYDLLWIGAARTLTLGEVFPGDKTSVEDPAKNADTPGQDK